MKITAVSIIVGAMLVFAPLTAQASVFDDLRAQISNLLQMITSLQQQVNQLENTKPAVTSDNITQLTKGSCLRLSYNLWIGKRDSNTNGEVSKLQRFLIKEDVYPEAIVSGYYGNLTAKAVMKWQKANGLDFVTIKSGVGKMTRAKLQVGCSGSTPHISSISKSYGYTLGQRGTLAKTNLEIKGSNFSGFEGLKGTYLLG